MLIGSFNALNGNSYVNKKHVSIKPANVSFGRAFTTQEQAKYENAIDKAFEKLNIRNFLAIAFDQSFPAETATRNIGIGTSFSEGALKTAQFMKKMFNITGLQLGPEGMISAGNTSPYSGSVFAYNNLSVDLGKLLTPEYESILDNESYGKLTLSILNQNERLAAFESAFNLMPEALSTAFSNFEKLPASSPLKKEYNTFIKANKDWLEADTMYEVLTNVYGGDNWEYWGQSKSDKSNLELDKALFNNSTDKKARNARVQELNEKTVTHGNNTVNIAGLHKFVQFLADKQQKEAKLNFNNEKIDVLGDCLIGFSPREHWANQEAFKKDCYMGCQNNGGIAPWGFAALDFSKLDGPTGKLLQKKFDIFFDKYDGARIDAAWQLVKPFVYQVSRDGNGNINNTWKVDSDNLGDKIFKMIIDTAEKKAKEQGKPFDKNKINLELLGLGIPGEVYGAAEKHQLPQIEITRYAKDEPDNKWATVNLLRGRGEDRFIVAPGTHDDISLVTLSNNQNYAGDKGLQVNYLSRDLNTGSWGMNIGNNDAKGQEQFRNAKFAELFTTKNLMATIYDLFGYQQAFNDQYASSSENTAKGKNWKLRMPTDVEKFYFTQIKDGLGLNLPNALKMALRVRGKENNSDNLVNALQTFEHILKEDGPMTQAEADKAQKEGKLNVDLSKLSVTI